MLLKPAFVIGLLIALLADIDLKKIYRAFEKNDLEKAMELLDETMTEYPDHPVVLLIYSQMMTSDTLNMYNLDSAKVLIDKGIDRYETLEEKTLEEMSEVGINYETFTAQYEKIKDIHLSMALSENTIRSFEWFMERYPEYENTQEFLRRKDSILYDQVVSLNTWQSYLNYYQNYSYTIYADEAKSKYDKLVFEERTASGQLKEYESFLREFPDNPHNSKIEDVVFKRRTASHLLKDYKRYVLDYPKSQHINKCFKLVYYLDKGLWESSIQHPQFDSALQIKNLESSFLIPVLEDDKFGFMDPNGNFQLQPAYDSIDIPFYQCGPLYNEIIPIKKQGLKLIINRNGSIIYDGGYDHMQDLGAGIMLIYLDGIGKLLHKTGFMIMANIDDAEVLKQRWIKVLKDGYWGLYAPNGQMLAEHKYDEIKVEGDFWMFRKDQLWGITSPEEILEQINEPGISLEYKFEEIELDSERLLIGFNDEREALIDGDIHFLIPWDKHVIYPDTTYYYSRQGESFRFFNREIPFLFNQSFDYLSESQHWFGLKSNQNWTLFDKERQIPYQSFVDSVHLFNRFAALVYRSGFPFVVFPNHMELPVLEENRVTTLQTPDRTWDYLLFESEKAMSVWDEQGVLCFSGGYDDINCLGKDLFKVTQRGKEGVVDVWGNILLPLSYDHIQVRDDLLFLIKDNKIGAYDLTTGKILPTQFDSRIRKLENKYITRKNGRYGLLDETGNELIPFEYNEIRAWNDSSVWVRTDTTWHVRPFNSDEIMLDDVIDYRWIAGSNREKFVLAQSAKGYGIISDMKGLILPMKYNDIRNMGTEETPIFVVEQSFPDAEFYIIMYADQQGIKLWSEAYRNEDYGKIYCDR